MSAKDYKAILGFTDEWLTLGLVTEASLQQSGVFYETSADRNTEHYRYGAFRQHLKDHCPLPVAMAEVLYALGAADADPAMGGAMMADIVSLPECPVSVTSQAVASGLKHLTQLVERQHLRRELQAVGVTPERFQHSIDTPNSTIQRILLETDTLSAKQLQILAEQGASRTIRNIARNSLRQRKHRPLMGSQEP